MKRWLLLSIAGLSLTGTLSFLHADDDKKPDGEKPIIKPRENEVRKGEGEKDRPKDGEREASKEKPRDGERREDERREKEVAKKPHHDAEAIERRLHELHAQLKKHAEAGHQEEVSRIKREIAEIHQAHAPKGGDREHAEHVKIAAQHIMEAAQHLRAAGMHDLAEHLGRQSKEMLQHASAHHKETPQKGPQPRGERPEHHADLNERLDDLTSLVKKLHERLERLEAQKK